MLIEVARDSNSSVEKLKKNDFSTPKTAFPTKMGLAIDWLLDHPGDMDKTGRELEKTCFPMEAKISFATWNNAKIETSKIKGSDL